MSDISRVIALARALAVGSQHLDEIIARGAATLARPPRMVAPVAQRYLCAFAGATRPRHRDVVHFLLYDRSWLKRRRETKAAPVIAPPTRLPLDAYQMLPARGAEQWAVPPIASTAALADYLELSVGELLWLSDSRRRVPSASRAPLHHYHYRVVEKRHGGLRLIEAPQRRLRDIQRRILSEILERVPQYYAAAHGFVRGRSIKTFAAPHVGKQVVLRLDLEDFFPRISGSRVQAIFRTMGYPETVADILGGLCTTATPAAVFAQATARARDPLTIIAARRLYTRPHLPQGAPTSPALANMCAYRLDCRLTGLADWAGADYTRYADDLAFSGDGEFARRVTQYAAQIAVIAREEGWNVQHRKTRVMRKGVRQQLAGVVVNTRVNVPRAYVDALKAILTNCVRHGPASQNRRGVPDFRAHLAGRVAWVSSLSAAKGKRLTRIFSEISWENAS